MTSTPSRWRRTLVLMAKIAFAAAILSYLLVNVQRHDGFRRLVEQPKQWTLVAAALACTFVAVALSFVRWFLLVRAVGLPFKLREALQLGSLGFVLNFVSLGSVGGDLYKAFFLARRRPGQRTEAVATVLFDRLFGLLAYLLLASAAILVFELTRDAPRVVVALADAILLTTAIAWLGVALVMLVPALSSERRSQRAARIPWVGSTAARLLSAIRVYRGQKRKLLGVAAVSFAGVFLSITSFYLMARGLPVHEPTFAQHLMIVPAANMAGALPLTPNGLGTAEAAAEVLYQKMPGSNNVSPGDGTMVALAQRCAMFAAAVVALAYFLFQRVDLRRVVADAESEEAAEMS
jgi:hypothetical protein